MLRIADICLTTPLLQAPMAGATDRIYRNLVREHGAGMSIGEMITSDLSLLNSKKTQQRLPSLDDISPRGIQIFGTEPDKMAAAAQFYVDLGAELIDINFGCPVKKVAGSKQPAGSALLKDERRVEQIIRRVVKAVDVPVTIKYRTGWQPTSRNAINIAKLAERAGVAAVALHGRTRADRYKPYAEYETIRLIKKQIGIPVIANGDILNIQQAAFVLNYTQADGLMLGRGSMGRPWIFSELAQELFGKGTPNGITIDDAYKKRTAIRHVSEIFDSSYSSSATNPVHGQRLPFIRQQEGSIRIPKVRQAISWYLKGMCVPASQQRQIMACKDDRQKLALFKECLNEGNNNDQECY